MRKSEYLISNIQCLISNKKNFIRNTASGGFTLVEILVVIAIMGILMTIGTSVFINILRSSNKSQVLGQVRGEGSKVLELVSRSFQNSMDVYKVDGTNNADFTCQKSIIVKNKSTNTVNSVGQATYTRFSFVQVGNNAAETNNYFAIHASEALPDLIDTFWGGNFSMPPTIPNNITNTSVGSGVNVVFADDNTTPCFTVRRIAGTPTSTLITIKYSISQTKKPPQDRKEFTGIADFDSTFTLRSY